MRLSTIVFLLSVWALPAGVEAQEPSFTLEEILAPPFPVQVVAAEDTSRVAWILDDRGRRNVFTAAGPDFEPVRLTDRRQDDGRPLGGLRITRDGRVIVYVVGGGANRVGEHPNPTSDPAGADQSVWVVPTSGGEPWTLGRGAAPVVSPDGGSVLFSRDGAFHRVAIGSEAPSEPVEAEILFQARGTSRAASYSPDGDKVAFVSDRGDHSFVGVYDFDAENLVWIAPSVDRDGFPSWSPDGSRLAFLRRAGALKGELFTFLTTWSFQVMVADLATGEATEVWRAPEGGGGFAQIYPAEPLRWAGDRLVFYSEHEGWMHLYSLPVRGGKPIDLTPGECEAEHSAIDPAGEWVAFSHNCDEIDRRQVSRVPTQGGEVELLTPAGGVHSAPVFADRGRRVFLRSANFRHPSAVATVNSDGSEFRRLQDASPWPPGEHLVEPSQVVFRAGDGLEVHGQLFEPRGPVPPGGRPALIFMHGGPMRQMLLGWHYMGYYTRCYAFNQYMAGRGWEVLSVNFRAGIGYGQGFRLADRQGPYGASEYQDIVAAARWLRGRDSVDSDRLALWGGSYGGYLTALGLARDSDLFAAGVDLHGVHDWAFRATDFTPGGGWGVEGEEALELALQSSPSVDVSFWTSPVLLVHGDDDRNVLFQQTTDLVQRLRRQGLEPEILVLPDEVHGFLRHASWLRVFEAAAEFLERHLGG